MAWEGKSACGKVYSKPYVLLFCDLVEVDLVQYLLTKRLCAKTTTKRGECWGECGETCSVARPKVQSRVLGKVRG